MAKRRGRKEIPGIWNKTEHNNARQRLSCAGWGACFHGSPHLTITQSCKTGTVLSSFQVTCPVCATPGAKEQIQVCRAWKHVPSVHSHKAVALRQGGLAPQRTFGHVWRYFWLSQLGAWGRLLASSGWSLVLLYTLQCTGQPPLQSITWPPCQQHLVRHCTQQVGCQLAAGHPVGELAKAAQEMTLEGGLEQGKGAQPRDR